VKRYRKKKNDSLFSQYYLLGAPHCPTVQDSTEAGKRRSFCKEKKNPVVPVESESCQPMSKRRKHLVSTFHVPEFRPQALIFHLIISSIYGFDGNLLRLWRY